MEVEVEVIWGKCPGCQRDAVPPSENVSIESGECGHVSLGVRVFLFLILHFTSLPDLIETRLGEGVETRGI